MSLLSSDFKENVQNNRIHIQKAAVEKNEKSLGVEIEPLLRDDTTRFVIFPVIYNDMWNMYQQAESRFWNVERVSQSMLEDYKDWQKKLTFNDMNFLKYVWTFFECRRVVNAELVRRLSKEVTVTEVKFFYGMQISTMNIHSMVYNMLINTYINDANEEGHLMNAVQNFSCVKRMNDWAMNFISSKKVTFGERVVASAAAAGIFFCSSFASMFWLLKDGSMPSITSSNKLISGDVELHCKFACLVFSHVVQKPSQERVRYIIKEAVKIEQEFVTDALPVKLSNMDSKLMCKYIEFVADNLLADLRVDKIYHTNNPFHSMDFINNKIDDERAEVDVNVKITDEVFTLDENMYF